MGQGDCDSNADCSPGLVCGNDNCVGSGFDTTDDCCMIPGGKRKNQLGWHLSVTPSHGSHVIEEPKL